MSNRVQWLMEDIQVRSEHLHALVCRLRSLIASVAPDATEGVKYGGLLYSLNGPVCGVFAYKHHVSLEFSNGTELADPCRVLEGGGKHRRHIKLKSERDIETRQVEDYLRRAFGEGNADGL
ncbi:MAG: DUF1801 domain-containing protein [Ectothiorhodospiraceae bacterium]|nr:DUF1801 domain-containing protein [Ectothiorhodospiraceae bacterium]MCH8502950.1 DUF1801 domain-containing protein [Ectothiorhodospiraceae bacterium]